MQEAAPLAGSSALADGAPLQAPVFAQLDEDGRREFWASLALRHCRGLGARSCLRLLRHFGSAYVALQCRKSWGDAQVNQARAAEMATGSWRVTAREEWDRARTSDAHILLWTDRLYPQRLRQLADAPVLLYARGDLSLLQAPALAIVGSRRATRQAQAVARYMARCLAACGITIVSGMAQGIDSAAHAAALQRVGSSIGVLGTGIDIRYPASSRGLYAQMEEKGLLLSEFAPGTPVNPRHFPIRNRIISGLSLGVLVVEAAQRSGSLITARQALEQNREVYAVPGPALDVHCMGCQELIRQGARPVFSADDILCDLAEQLQPFGINRESLPREERELAGSEEALLHLPANTAAVPSQAGERGPAAQKQRPGSARQSRPAGQAAEQHGAEPAAPYAAGTSPASAPALTGRQPATEACPEAEALLSAGAARAAGADLESALIHYLQEHGPIHCDALAEALQKPVQQLTVVLLGMEMLGQVRRLPGGRYEVVS